MKKKWQKPTVEKLDLNNLTEGQEKMVEELKKKRDELKDGDES